MRALIFLLALTLNVHAEILIGVAGPMTGSYAVFGSQMMAGVKAAVDDLNANGGIGGDLVEVLTADDACDLKQAENAATTLINQNVSVVIGHFCSYPSLAAAKLYEVANIPMLSPSATLPALTEAGLSNVIRLSSRDDAQGSIAATRIQQNFPAAQIAVLSDGTGPSQALIATFKASFAGQQAAAFTFKPDTNDFEGIISDLKSKNIKALYCGCSAADAGTLAQQLDGKIKIFGPDALLVPQFWELAEQAGEGTTVSFAVDPQTIPDAQDLIRKLKSEKLAISAVFIQSYAAIQVFAAASKATALTTGKALSIHLQSGTVFPTVLGKLSFDGKGDVREHRFVWYEWSNGKFSQQ